MRFSVRLTPHASQNKIETLPNGDLKVWVTASPVRGAANAALVGLLAKHFGFAKTRIRIVKGLSNRTKMIVIEN